MGQPQPLFRLFSVLFKQTLQFLQQINVINVLSIQYTMPGFEPTTSQTWVVSHNHWPGLPPHFYFNFETLFIPADGTTALVSSSDRLREDLEAQRRYREEATPIGYVKVELRKDDVQRRQVRVDNKE